MTMDLATEPRFRLGSLSVNPATREVVFTGGRETIEPRVMEVLLVLARAGGEVVSRDQLVERCWEGRAVSEDAINRVISRVRKVAELTQGRDFTLETIPKTGYRLIVTGEAPAEPAAQPAQPPNPAPAAQTAPPARKPWRAPATVVALLVAMLAIAGIAWAISWRAPPDDAPLTLAVLPFDDLSPTNSDAPLATRMSREIRNTLSRVRGLRVLSDASSFAVAGENLAAPDTARRLGANLLIDGSFTREGEQIRMTAELVDGASGVNLWTGSQSGPAADLDAVRQLMAAAIFEQLVARIGPKRLAATSPPRRGDPRVYRMLLEAAELLQSAKNLRPFPSRTEEMLDIGDKANELVNRALVIDPDDASALSFKGQMLVGGFTRETQGMTSSERRDDVANYLRRALAADPDNVYALSGLGDHYSRNEWRWADSKALLERALALDPNFSDAHLVYTYLLAKLGRCAEAVEHARAVNAIDPEFGWSTLGLPRALKCAGGEEEANRLYLRQLGANPDEAFIIREIYLNYLERRDVAGLRALPDEIRKANAGRELSPLVSHLVERINLAIGVLEGGDPRAFLASIETDLSEDIEADKAGRPSREGRGLSDMMWMHAIEFSAGGDARRAVDMLETAVSHYSLYIPETLPYGAYEFTPEVRNDPRYQAIWRSDPRLRELRDMRLAALKEGQMYGVLPDGKLVKPVLPVQTAHPGDRATP